MDERASLGLDEEDQGVMDSGEGSSLHGSAAGVGESEDVEESEPLDEVAAASAEGLDSFLLGGIKRSRSDEEGEAEEQPPQQRMRPQAGHPVHQQSTLPQHEQQQQRIGGALTGSQPLPIQEQQHTQPHQQQQQQQQAQQQQQQTPMLMPMVPFNPAFMQQMMASGQGMMWGPYGPIAPMQGQQQQQPQQGQPGTGTESSQAAGYPQQATHQQPTESDRAYNVGQQAQSAEGSSRAANVPQPAMMFMNPAQIQQYFQQQAGAQSGDSSARASPSAAPPGGYIFPGYATVLPHFSSQMAGRSPVPAPRIPGVSLHLSIDDEQLSSYQILVRKQLEIFEATQEDVDSNIQGRKKQIVLGQVGIRCRHCAGYPLRQRGRGAIYYPTKLNGVYQAAQNMASTHLLDTCQAMPAALKNELKRLRERKDTAGGGKQYWADGARAVGLEEFEYGLRLRKAAAAASAPSAPEEATPDLAPTQGESPP